MLLTVTSMQGLTHLVQSPLVENAGVCGRFAHFNERAVAAVERRDSARREVITSFGSAGECADAIVADHAAIVALRAFRREVGDSLTALRVRDVPEDQDERAGAALILQHVERIDDWLDGRLRVHDSAFDSLLTFVSNVRSDRKLPPGFVPNPDLDPID